MRRLVPVVCALAALSEPLLAWSGRLLRVDGSPLAGAEISVVGHLARARSAEDGSFRIDGPRPPVTLLVELPSGQAVAIEVPALAPSGPATIYVDPALHQQIDVLVRRETDLESLPGTVSRPLSASDLVARGEATVRAALETEPGTGPDVSDQDQVPALRGQARGRTLVLLDGAPVVSERRAGFSAAGAPPGTLAGIDVARGPNTILYGTSAMAGVIALRSPWADPGAEARGEGTLELAAGDVPSQAAAVRWAENGWALAAGRRDRDAPEAAGGARLAGKGRQESVFLGRSARSGEAGLLRLGLRVDRLTDAERLARAEDPGRTLVPLDRLSRLTARWDGPLAGAGASLVAWLGEQRRETVLGAQGGGPDAGLATTTSAREAGARAALTRDEAGHSLVAGAEVTLRDGVRVRTASGPPALDPEPLRDGRQLGLALFSIATVPAGRSTTMHFGLRGEHIASRARAPTGRHARSRQVLSASFALSRRLGPRQSLSLQLASGFREPLLTERFMTGITGRGLLLANPVLDPERSRHVDLAWRWSGRRIALEASAFRTRIDDVIERDFLDPAEVPPAFAGLPVDVYRFVNGGRARLDGLELAASLRLFDGGSLWLAAHRLRGTDGAGETLADLPPDALRADFEVRAARVWRLGVLLGLFARNERPGPREVALPSFALVHLRAFRSVSDRWEVGLIVRNALDRGFPSGPRRDDPPAPGRSAVLILRGRR